MVLGSNMKNYLFWKELMRRHSFEGRIILQLLIEVYYKLIIRIDSSLNTNRLYTNKGRGLILEIHLLTSYSYIFQ